MPRVIAHSSTCSACAGCLTTLTLSDSTTPMKTLMR